MSTLPPEVEVVLRAEAAVRVHLGYVDAETRQRVGVAVHERGPAFLVHGLGRVPIDPATGRFAVTAEEVLYLDGLLRHEEEQQR